MADTEGTTTTTETEGTTTEEAQSKELGDSGQKALAAERAARKAAEQKAKDTQKALDDLAAKVQGFEDRDKSEAEKSADRIKALETALAEKDSQLSKKELDVLRTKIANREGKHVPAESLTGSTEEELIASADRLLEWRGTGSTSTSSIRQTGHRSGAGAPPSGDSPQQKAAAALRAMRAGNQ